MASEQLTAADANDLVDYLEAGRYRLGDPAQLSVPSEATRPLERPKERSLGSYIRKFFLDHIAVCFLWGAAWELLKRFTGWGQPEVPSTTATAETLDTFYCCWPGCETDLTTYSRRREHDVQHWVSRKQRSDTKGHPMPTGGSLVVSRCREARGERGVSRCMFGQPCIDLVDVMDSDG